MSSGNNVNWVERTGFVGCGGDRLDRRAGDRLNRRAGDRLDQRGGDRLDRRRRLLRMIVPHLIINVMCLTVRWISGHGARHVTSH